MMSNIQAGHFSYDAGYTTGFLWLLHLLIDSSLSEFICPDIEFYIDILINKRSGVSY